MKDYLAFVTLKSQSLLEIQSIFLPTIFIILSGCLSTGRSQNLQDPGDLNSGKECQVSGPWTITNTELDIKTYGGQLFHGPNNRLYRVRTINTQLVLEISDNDGFSFQNFNTFTYSTETQNYFSTRIIFNDSGTIYMSALIEEESANVKSYFHIVRKSIDGGISFSVIDNIDIDGYMSTSLYVDSKLILIHLGESTLRSSRNDGVTWITNSPMTNSGGRLILTGNYRAANGDLYMGGIGYNPDNTYNWFTYRSSDNALTFPVVDLIAGGGYGGPYSFIEAGNNIIAAGEIYINAGGASNWVVRISKDGGASWQNAQTLEFTSGPFFKGTGGLTIDSRGTIYLTGNTRFPAKQYIQQSDDQGMNWRIIYGFDSPVDLGSIFYNIRTDAKDGLELYGLGGNIDSSIFSRRTANCNRVPLPEK